MKRILPILLTSLSLILVGNIANAQVKIGYINLDTLMAQMPETKEVKKQVDAYTKLFIDHLTKMNNDYASYTLAYVYVDRTMTDSILAVESKKLQMIQKEMQEFQDNARVLVEVKKKELIKPLSNKAIVAIKVIAKENGIIYVIDSSKSTKLIVALDGTDLMAAAKAKLGIK